MIINKITLIILALAGAAIIFYVLMIRSKKDEVDVLYDPQKDDPVNHIKNRLFLGIPLERILFGYFVIVLLTYIGKIIAGSVFGGLSIVVLYLSAVIFSLVIYKLSMLAEVSKKFNLWMLLSAIFSAIIFIVVLYTLEIDFRTLLANTREYHLVVHLLGLVLGLGGTLVIDIMFTHFLKKFRISSSDSVIMHLISQMIVLGIFLLIFSGIALVLIDPDTYLNSSRFLMKMTVVFIILINGGVLNLYVTAKLNKISLLEEHQGQHEKLKKISFALGAVSLISWLSAFLLAMLKGLFTMPYLVLLGGYLALAIAGIVISQLAKVYYEKQTEDL